MEDVLAPALARASQSQPVLTVFAADSFFSSAGIAVLLAHVLPLIDQGKDIRTVHPAAYFRRVLQIVG